MAGDGTTELVSRLILGALSTAGSLSQLIPTIRKGRNWGKRAKYEVGSLGAIYAVVIKLPLWLYTLLLSLATVWFLIVVFAGIQIASQGSLHPFMSTAFSQAYWLFGLGVLLIVAANTNLLSSVLLHLTKGIGHLGLLPERMRHLDFKPGWVNANWQLNYHEDFFAMNIDINECSSLATVIYDDILAKKQVTQSSQAAEPENVNKDELANYLLFKCFTESWVNQERMGSEMVDQSQEYLAWATATTAHPFKPETLRETVSSKASLYEQLKKLPEVLSSNGTTPTPAGALPSSDQFDSAMQSVANRLVEKFNGEGARLALSRLTGHASVYLLLKRLNGFDRLRGPEKEGIRRLYLKLSLRMNVWPILRHNVGPLLYPQNIGIAILFLNKGCLKVPNDVEQLNVADDGVWKLVAAAEDQVVNFCYGYLLEPSNKPAKSAFTRAVFNCEPEQLDLWTLSDYIDLWLYRHARKCASRKPQKDKSAAAGAAPAEPAAASVVETPCPMLADTGACYCDAASKPWRIEGSSFIKD